MNPIRIFVGLVQALSAATAAFLEPYADQLDLERTNAQGGSQGQGENQAPAVPSPVPQMPVPLAGETSEDFALRWPTGAPSSCPIAPGLKYDPWRVAWIPVEAAFSLPPL